MWQASMTIIGLYNWDDSLFDGLHLPEQIAKDDFIDELLSMAGGQNALYPDFDLTKRLITAWSGRRLPAWERMAKALNSEYNPIYNYDRTEEYTDTRNLHTNQKETRNLQQTQNGSNSESVSAFDSSDMQPKNKIAVNGTNTDSGTVAHDIADTGTVKHEAKLFGNIGVTTTQQMINEEIGLRKTDLVEIIIGEFIARFCLDVYN